MKQKKVEVSQDSKNYFKALIIIISICVSLTACANPVIPEGSLSKTTDTSDNAKIIGRWQWVQSIGGIAGIRVTPESSGRSEILDFDDDNILRQYINDNPAVENNYRLGRDVTIFSNDIIPVIFLDGTLSAGYYFENNNSLILYDNLYDGFTRYYERN